jgi:hypothetical protein
MVQTNRISFNQNLRFRESFLLSPRLFRKNEKLNFALTFAKNRERNVSLNPRCTSVSGTPAEHSSVLRYAYRYTPVNKSCGRAGTGTVANSCKSGEPILESKAHNKKFVPVAF